MDFSEVIINRFWCKVLLAGPDECWGWLGEKDGTGYAVFVQLVDGKRQKLRGSRVALELSGMPRPEGLFALHTCDNKGCVNPSHLYWGTKKQNTADAMRRHPTFGIHCSTVLGHSKPPRLSSEQIVEARALRASGVPLRKLAERYDITHQGLDYALKTEGYGGADTKFYDPQWTKRVEA